MKKYILGAAFVLAVLVAPTASYASGLTSAQIQSILTLLSVFGADSATISSVTVALSGGTPSTTSGRYCHTFNTDLTVGSSGEDVIALNTVLASLGVDTTGNTSLFTENNAGDVVSFQAKYGIRQTGYVGPMTRAKLNALYGCTAGQTPPTTPSSSTAQPTLSLYASPETVTAGQSTKIYWASKNAWDCSDEGGKMGATGSYLFGPLYSDSTRTVTCTGSGGSVTKSVTVTVNPTASQSTFSFSAKDPNPTTGFVDLIWKTSIPSSVAIDMTCTSQPVTLTTDKGNTPTCAKGGVWTWQNQSEGSIRITPSGNTSAVTVPFTFTILDQSGAYTNQKQTINVTFPTQSPPWVSGGFSSQQQFGSANIVGTYTYEIKNYRSTLVLDVIPRVNCNDSGIAPNMRDCSQYWFNLSGKAAETYSSVQGDPYVKGGASYRFTGSNGSLNISGFINPSYATPPVGYITPVPDNVDYTFILRDTTNGAVIWSQTQRVQFKG